MSQHCHKTLIERLNKYNYKYGQKLNNLNGNPISRSAINFGKSVSNGVIKSKLYWAGLKNFSKKMNFIIFFEVKLSNNYSRNYL